MKQAALLVTLILTLAAAASARPPEGAPRGGPPGGGDRLEQLIERLDLPPEVLSEVDAVIDTSRDRHRELRRELRSAHEAMRGLLEAEVPDEGAVLAQAEEVGRLRTELDKDRLRTLLRVQALLPADARARLVEQMKRRGRGPRDRRPPRGEAPIGNDNGPPAQGGGEDR
jgi:Spy/CpxP family protein refolding chaperone